MIVSILRFSRKWHRVGAWGLGIFFVLWTVTGIFMLLPSGPPNARDVVGGDLTLHDSVLAPQVAFAALRGRDDVRLREVELRNVAGRLAWRFTLGRGIIRVVDAQSGEPLILDDTTATRLAILGLGHKADVSEVQRITDRERRYRGPFPAVRVSFADSRNSVAYVSMDGLVAYVDDRQRVKSVAGGLHTFVFPMLTSGRDGLRKQLLVFVSILSLALIATGYGLLLPARRAKRDDDDA